jgi:predicted nucleic acid-binding protein
VKYLLHTNVISEIRKPDCNPAVTAFIDGIPREDLFLCTMSIGEIAYGTERLAEGKKKKELSHWLNRQLPAEFENRIIDLDTGCMLEWGRLCAGAGRTLPFKDSIIAAAALAHRLTILTRNTGDFEGIEGLKFYNPWS